MTNLVTKKNIMKTHQFFIALLFSVYTNAQVTLTVPYSSSKYDYDQNGIYYKDLENKMAHYIGTWEGTQNNKKYIFQFVKFTQHYETDYSKYYYIDILSIKFKVIDLNTNQTLYDDTNITNYDDFKISFLGLISGGCWYLDKVNCNLEAKFNILKVPNNANQIKYCHFRWGEWFIPGNCPYTSAEQVPMFLPKEDLILTRQ